MNRDLIVQPDFVVLENGEKIPVIPIKAPMNGLAKEHRKIQEHAYNQRRENIFNVLRGTPGFVNAVQDLAPNDIGYCS